jgi:hypothetical protein
MFGMSGSVAAKRGSALLLLAAWLLPLLLFPPAARADILAEPNNDFYAWHSDECVPLSRSFCANGASGSVSVKNAPGSRAETALVANGEIINIMFLYNRNGEIWGVTQIYTEGAPYRDWPNGWIPLDQLLLVYDYISFAEEHQDDFYAYAGNYETLKGMKKIVLWPWPGSGGAQRNLEAITDENYHVFSISHAYRDEEGREWGFIGYWMGHKNAWICLSAPENRGIPAFNPPPPPAPWQPDEGSVPKSALPLPFPAIVLTVAAVALTAALIRAFWKPGKGKA